MRRTAAVLTALGLAFGGLAVAASPAGAATTYSTAIGPLDTSSPGHVTGTVTSDAPVIKVYAESSGGAVASAITVADNSAGSYALDLVTWGLDSAQVRVQTCEADETGCADAATSSFTASDIEPTITWAAADGATVSSPSYDVKATDSGGGYLFVGASNVSWSPELLSKDGTTTTLDLESEGTQTLTVERCNDTSYTACTPLATHQVTLDRPISADAFLPDPWSTSPASINVEETPSITAYVDLRGTGVNPPASMGLAIHRTLLDSSGTQVGMGFSAFYDLPRDDGTISMPVGLSHLKSGSYTLRIETAWGTDPADRETEDFPLDITNAAPVPSSVTRSLSSIYPADDGYRDSARFTATVDDPQVDSAKFEIRSDSTDTVVRTRLASQSGQQWTVSWDGRRSDGTMVPAGTYTVTARFIDHAGTTGASSTSVAVVRKHLATRSWSKTVTPSASYVKQYVGSCSTVRKPSLRGWSGSFGLYSNTKCSTSGQDYAETHHAITVAKPSSLRRYLDVRVSAYGGAATSRPSSTMTLAYVNTDSEWHHLTSLGSTLGTHRGDTVGSTSYIHDRSTDQPWVYWGSWVTKGRRYDVKNYTVRVRYEALVAD